MPFERKIYCDTLGCKMGYALKAIIKTLNSYFCRHGLELTVEQMYLLLILDKEDELIQQDIADITGKDKSAVFRQIDALEKKQLVARLENPEDKRKKRLMLTKYGLEMLKKAQRLESEVMDHLACDFTSRELDTFEEVLKKIYENAERIYGC